MVELTMQHDENHDHPEPEGSEDESEEEDSGTDEFKSWWDVARKFRKVANTLIEYHTKLEKLEKQNSQIIKNQTEIVNKLENHSGQLIQIQERIKTEVKVQILEKIEDIKNKKNN